MSDLEDACLRLRDHLFGRVRYGIDEPGFLGVGAGELFVYLHASRKKWRGPTPAEWEGYPVTYRYGVGPIVAAVAG